MLAVFLAAQLAVAQPDTATYSSANVRALVTEASQLNRVVPAALGRYRARIESEIMLGLHDGGGKEMAFSLEQVASDLTWTRTGEFAQHVVGYRTQMFGFAALIGLFRNSWFVPSLYGNRLALMWGADPGRRRDTTYYAVHPLADDRERFYRFTGGDTVEVLRIEDRDIRIARVNVTVRDDIPRHTIVFVGELDLDLARMHLVRMRGAFYVASGAPQESQRFATFQVLQFVEIVNNEIDGNFWLPQYQRFEDQIGASILGQAREAIRIVTHMTDVTVDPPDSAMRAASDAQRALPHRVTFAPTDSLGKFRGWQRELGTATVALSTEDFNDVGPNRWRPKGPPTAGVEVEHVDDLVHFNRIEGLFTGLGGAVHFRDASPGLTLRASGGYAWSERTVRGRAAAELKRGAWTYSLRGGRSLDITNDFRDAVDSGSTLGAVFGLDDYDYVDRFTAGAAAVFAFPRRAGLVRFESGFAEDRAAIQHLAHGPFSHTPYPQNRGIDEGRYVRSALTIEWRGGVLGEDLIRPGIGASLSYLRGDGDLNFQRVELGLGALRNFGRLRVATRARAGVVLGSPPPQQLFEIAGEENLPGFAYKQFAGDRAVSMRAYALFRLPLWEGPLKRFSRRRWFPAIVIPGVSPSFFVSVQGGWTGASDDRARAAILRLGSRAVTDSAGVTTFAPVSTTMGRPRGSVGGGLTLFQGFLGFGIARPLDRIATWRGMVVSGLYF